MMGQNSELEKVAAAIYNTHWKPPAPRWENASSTVRNWVFAQARNAIEAIRPSIEGLADSLREDPFAGTGARS